LELLAPISIAPEPVFHLGSLVITNSMLTTLVVTFLLAVLIPLFGSRFSLIPKGFANFFEFVLESLFDLATQVVGEKKARKFFPLAATIFLFVITCNYIGLLPVNGPIYVRGEHEVSSEEASIPDQVVYAATTEKKQLKPTLHKESLEAQANETEHDAIKANEHEAITENTTDEHGEAFIKIPIFRSPSADLNMTLALALFAVLSIQIWGIRYLKLGYFKKFINFSNPINFFVGLLEIVSEISKIISFSFRLFGNVFAGEVLLIVIASLTASLFAIGSLPFLFLELFVGFIQALVFAMLTLVFLGVATESHDH